MLSVPEEADLATSGAPPPAADRRGDDLILGRNRRRFLELQLQLFEHLAAALRGLLLAPQPGDLQFVIVDQRLSLLPRLALGGQGRRQRRDRLDAVTNRSVACR